MGPDPADRVVASPLLTSDLYGMPDTLIVTAEGAHDLADGFTAALARDGHHHKGVDQDTVDRAEPDRLDVDVVVRVDRDEAASSATRRWENAATSSALRSTPDRTGLAVGTETSACRATSLRLVRFAAP
ncbi:hypothetical protein ITP53_20365 [Nonomuraea sp. K274]|uniref:Uncharacterized protein n=1 Tax=Nonomuraea cypriaca TaxID=1187855 RepID=A0A931EZY2_9ACTN|nr:hypothetical protein [Nonomuraea cypriaca]MBF8188047.1 hypothetical protein [Nonomuraea cypriaca]